LRHTTGVTSQTAVRGMTTVTMTPHLRAPHLQAITLAVCAQGGRRTALEGALPKSRSG
jgi:phage terminase large subunit-like protein